jgi:hypothetical protein
MNRTHQEVIMCSFIRLGSTIAAVALIAAPLAAQTPGTRSPLPLAEVSPYVGYFMASNIAEGPLGTSLSSGSGALYGAQIRIPLVPAVAVIGNFGYSTGKLEFGVPLLGGVSFGDAKTYLYDGGLQLSAPALARGTRALIPFAQLGAGAVRREITAGGLANTSTNFAWNAGFGADMQVVPGIGVRVLMKDYIGKFDIREATGLDVDSRTMNDWALSVGVNISF